MAKSKSFRFPLDHQLVAGLGKALAHPARVMIVSRLAGVNGLPYPRLIAGIPLNRTTINQHLRILEHQEMIRPVMLEDNTVGFQLNSGVFRENLSLVQAIVSQVG